MTKLAIILVAALAVLALVACGGDSEDAPSAAPSDSSAAVPAPEPTTPPAQSQTTGDSMSKQYDSPPAMMIDVSKAYKAVVTTTHGEIRLDLFASEVPNTVNNFVFLAREGFYDNVIFHRVIPGFMIQGGDPTGTGSGGPGYRFADEPVRRQYTPGTLAMANAGPNTNGSQFFIMHGAVPLPPNYTIFGFATDGLDTVDAIANVRTDPSGEGSRPLDPPQILTVEIIEEG